MSLVKEGQTKKQEGLVGKRRCLMSFPIIESDASLTSFYIRACGVSSKNWLIACRILLSIFIRKIHKSAHIGKQHRVRCNNRCYK